MKIVRFENGKFGIRKGFWPFYFFMSSAPSFHWFGREPSTQDFIELPTYEAAERRLERYQAQLDRPLDTGVPVIRTLSGDIRPVERSSPHLPPGM